MTAKDFTPAIEADLDNEVAKEESLLQIATSWANYWAEKLEDAKSRVEEHVEALKALYVLYYEFVTPYTAK